MGPLRSPKRGRRAPPAKTKSKVHKRRLDKLASAASKLQKQSEQSLEWVKENLPESTVQAAYEAVRKRIADIEASALSKIRHKDKKK